MITIYHNPACGTSRNTLALIRNSGAEPQIIEYLKTPPSRGELKALLHLMLMSPRQLLREKGTPFQELGLGDPAKTDDQLLDAMIAHPILINRPIVVTPLGAKLCRPSELVLDILPDPQRGAFVKEDGEAVVDANGKRLVFSLSRRLVAEGLGTAILLAAVVGSGIMAERLAGGNTALALLANTIATGAALVVLITIFGPVSGAHFNPCVTLWFVLRRDMAGATALLYGAAQLAGAVLGVWLAHAMFAMPILEVSHKLRDGPAQWLAEGVATFGLIVTIAGGIRFAALSTPVLVGLYITAAYWFTASTSFANPAVTLARSLSDSFAGIAPSSAPGFIAAQVAATLLAWLFCRWFFEKSA